MSLYFRGRKIVILTIVGIAAVGFWRWSFHEAKPSSPNANHTANLNQEATNSAIHRKDMSEWAHRLAGRNGANDLASVTNKFKEASDCLLYYSVLGELDSELNDERLNDLSNETLATLIQLDASSSRYLEIARQTEASCSGSDREEVARVYTDALLKAALLGNHDAESCYVMMGYRDRTSEGRKSSALRTLLEKRYRQHAPVFTKNALERGDPYVAQQALYRYIARPTGHPSVHDGMAKADPYLTWRATRLASLRGTREQRVRLESSLAAFEQLQLLEPFDIQRADAWATATYEQEFTGQPPINLDSQAPCYSSSGLAL